MTFLFDEDLRAWKSYDRRTKRLLLTFMWLGVASAVFLLVEYL